MQNTEQIQMIAAVKELEFTLRGSGGGWYWYYPDGRPTGICRSTIEAAPRAMMFMAPGLVAEPSKALLSAAGLSSERSAQALQSSVLSSFGR
jgi:hypothetical protein